MKLQMTKTKKQIVSMSLVTLALLVGCKNQAAPEAASSTPASAPKTQAPAATPTETPTPKPVPSATPSAAPSATPAQPVAEDSTPSLDVKCENAIVETDGVKSQGFVRSKDCRIAYVMPSPQGEGIMTVTTAADFSYSDCKSYLDADNNMPATFKAISDRDQSYQTSLKALETAKAAKKAAKDDFDAKTAAIPQIRSSNADQTKALQEEQVNVADQIIKARGEYEICQKTYPSGLPEKCKEQLAKLDALVSHGKEIVAQLKKLPEDLAKSEKDLKDAETASGNADQALVAAQAGFAAEEQAKVSEAKQFAEIFAPVTSRPVGTTEQYGVSITASNQALIDAYQKANANVTFKTLPSMRAQIIVSPMLSVSEGRVSPFGQWIGQVNVNAGSVDKWVVETRLKKDNSWNAFSYQGNLACRLSKSLGLDAPSIRPATLPVTTDQGEIAMISYGYIEAEHTSKAEVKVPAKAMFRALMSKVSVTGEISSKDVSEIVKSFSLDAEGISYLDTMLDEHFKPVGALNVEAKGCQNLSCLFDSYAAQQVLTQAQIDAYKMEETSVIPAGTRMVRAWFATSANGAKNLK